MVIESIDNVVLARTVSNMLPSGYPKIEQVAIQLGISVRSLQRRLHTLGITYSGIVEEVRCDEACRLLQKPETTVIKVSKLLGYKDPSSFSRAFMRWKKMGPLCYRERHKQNSRG